MFGKLARQVKGHRSRPPSPEFASKDAKAHDLEARSTSGNRVSRIRDTLHTRHKSQGEEIPIYLDTGLEALCLESLIAPSLRQMRPTLKAAEDLLPPMPTRRGSLEPPARAFIPVRSYAERDAVVLRELAPSGVAPRMSVEARASGVEDAFDLELDDEPTPLVTPMPKRPQIQRKAASYRTQRELPLRVQAVRRSHQEQFAQALMASSRVRALNAEASGGEMRRASEADVGNREAPVRPRIDPLQRTGRSQSTVPMSSSDMQGRSRSQSRDGSRRRHERLPSGPHNSRAQPTPDFYLQAAFDSWSFDP